MIYRLDPSKDVRWQEFLTRQPNASVFHSVGWLEALRSTYGYEPLAYTTAAPSQELRNGLLFCDVDSWITGRRLVSVPFADHCEILCESREDLEQLLTHVKLSLPEQRLRYLEIRPTGNQFCEIGAANGFEPSAKHYLHQINLTPSTDQLLRSFDKDCIQRRIRRADRAGLEEHAGSSEALLLDFFSLFTLTRSRHHLPPTPLIWFRNLKRWMRDALEIRVAYKDRVPIASILTLRFKNVVYYKYGGSDARFNKFGAMPWLFWKTIVAAKAQGAVELDLGRTEQGHSGLLVFKNHFAAQPQEMTYWQYSKGGSPEILDGPRLDGAKRVFAHLPNSLLRVIGRLAYRHIG